MKKVRFLMRLKWLVVIGLCASFTNMMAQITVTGTVKDDQKEPIVGATIIIKGSKPLIGTTTDIDGNFKLNVNGPDDVLEIKMMSFQTLKIAVGNKTVIPVVMKTASQELETVVKVGYGQIKKKDATGSIAVVSKEELTKIPAASFDKALQGRAPGVMVTATSGAPGSGPSIKIRGVGSINAGSEPLYVIDGLAVENSQASAGGVNPLTSISPDDIESISILKDASATAIYGARGANGVVIISTKRGTAGDKKTRVSVSAFTGFSRFPGRYNLMNADMYSKYVKILHDSAGDSPNFYSYATDSARDGNAYTWGDRVNTDWQKAITRSHAPMKSINMTVSGGGANSNFSIGGNYYDEEGTTINNYMKRYGLRANSDFKVSEWIKVGESMNVSKNDQQSVPNYLGTALTVSPLMPIHNANNEGGYMGAETRYVGNHDQINPVAVMNLNKTQGTNTRVLTNLYAEITPASIGFLKGLVYRVDFGYDYMISNTRNFVPIYNLPTNGNRSHSVAELNQGNTLNRMWKVNNLLSYANSFGQEDENKVKPHNISLMVGQEALEFRKEGFSVTAMNFPAGPDYPVFAQALESTLPGGDINAYRMYSYLGRFLYDYKGKYLLTVNIRNDWSSKFGQKNRSGWFPSFSGGWKFNEDLLKGVEWISMAKLRGGWGQTGNDNLGGGGQAGNGFYAYNEYFDKMTNSRYPFGSAQEVNYGMQLYSSTANPYLKWESTSMTNFGLDVSLLQNKIQFTMEYYVKNQHGMLVRNPMPLSAGRLIGPADPWVNLGDIQNSGYEFNVIYSKREGDFNYNVSANLTTIKNVVKDLPAGSMLYSPDATYTSYTVPGHTIGSMYGYICEGIFRSQEDIDNHETQEGAKPGDLMFKDVNGDRKIDANDRTIIGKSIPNMIYGLNFDCSYKGLDFSIFFQGVKGNDLYNGTKAGLISPGNFADYNKLEDALNYWSPSNPNSNIPRIDKNDANKNARFSTYFLEDGSFLRLKNIQIGYTLPKKWIDAAKVSRTRFYISLTNLYTFTKYSGYDPEVGTDNPLKGGYDNGFYPVPRTYCAGVQIEF